MSVKSVKLEVSNQNQRMSILAPPVQFTSVTQSCPTLWDCSTPELPFYQQLLEPTQTHVHWVSDDILPSHPPLFPSPPAFNLSQHQCLFQWVSSLHQVAKVLEFQLQHQSFHQKKSNLCTLCQRKEIRAVQRWFRSCITSLCDVRFSFWTVNMI